MRNRILRNFVITMAITLLVVTVLIIVSFIIVSNDYSKKEIKNFADETVKQVEKFKSQVDLNRFLLYKQGGYIKITVFNSKGEEIGDTYNNGEYLKSEDPTKYLIDDLIGEDVENLSTQSDTIESPYIEGNSRVLVYCIKVEMPKSEGIDVNGYLILRFTTSIVTTSYPLFILIISLLVFWVIMVLLLAGVVNLNIKATLAPLQNVQKIMQDIQSGNYKKAEVNKYLVASKADKMVEQIDSIGEMINDTMYNLDYEKTKLAVLLNAIHQGIIVFDNKSNIVNTNPQVKNLLGFEVKSQEDFMNNKECIDVYKQVTQAYDVKQEITTTLFINNNWLRVETVFPDNKEYSDGLYMLLLLTDITLEKQTAQARSEFFANASHELKTPLTAISGYSELLTNKELPDNKKKKCAEEIYQNSQKMKGLIDQILEIGKIDSVGKTIEKEELLLEDVVDDVMDSLQVVADKKNIELFREGTGTIKGNKKQIISLVRNLVSNGIKYNNENGFVKVIIEDKDSEVIMKVQDNGIGISKENIDKIFERFYKVDESHTQAGVESSTGLGLSIVKHIVESHNGNIEVLSELNKGSTFIITFKKGE